MLPKLVIGYIVRDEEDMLRKTLPKISPFVNGIVAVDGGSVDLTASMLNDYGACVRARNWDGNFSAARNECINLGQSKHPGAHMLMLDGDEALTAADFVRLKSAIADSDEATSFAFPRYEFVDDLFHFNPAFYPDYQCRCFKLGIGYRYAGIIHEQLVFGGESQTAYQAGRCVVLPYIHIFHYGKCKSPAHLWLKYENYRRTSEGEPLLTEIPRGVELPASYSHGPKLFFHGERPI